MSRGRAPIGPGRGVAGGADLCCLRGAAHRPGPAAGYRAPFTEAIADDLSLPAAPAVAHAVAGADDLGAAQKRALLLDVDRVLGLSLDAPAEGGRVVAVRDTPEGQVATRRA